MRELLEKDEARIRQIIERETGTMSWFELRNPEGKLKLKFTLLKQINSILTGAKIRNLYFTNFIMH